jgi:hypothetical protein
VHEALTGLPSYRIHAASLQMESFYSVDQKARFNQTAGSKVIKLQVIITKVLQHGMTMSGDKHFNSFKHGGKYNYHIVTTTL